jgi:hypothetical protein
MPKVSLNGYTKGSRGPRSSYPWDRWFAMREPFLIERGVDFQCGMSTMVQSLRNRAKARGVGLSIRERGTVLQVIVRTLKKKTRRAGKRKAA